MTLPARPIARFSLAATALVALAQTGCPSPPSRSETLDPSSLPQDVRADYEVFAQRCSKCHSLARPLNSGIVDDTYWALYVARMRRQPASGISVEDARVILRFLHYYSLEEIRKKASHESHESHDSDHPPATPPVTPASPLASPTPASSPPPPSPPPQGATAPAPDADAGGAR